MLVRWNDRGDAQVGDAVRRRSRDVAPVEDDPARRRRMLAGQQVEERGLSRPVRPDHGVQRALLDLERDRVDRGEGPEGLGQALRPNEGHRLRFRRARDGPRARPEARPRLHHPAAEEQHHDDEGHAEQERPARPLWS